MVHCSHRCTDNVLFLDGKSMRSELMFCICHREEDMACAALLPSHSSPAPHNPPDPLVTPSHGCLLPGSSPSSPRCSPRGWEAASWSPQCPLPCPFPAAGYLRPCSSSSPPLQLPELVLRQAGRRRLPLLSLGGYDIWREQPFLCSCLL